MPSTISPTAAARAVIGRSATSTTRPARSLYVRLHGPKSGPGAAGKWTDAATGDHGDLLDLIARARGLDRLGDILDEARAFLSLPRPEWTSPSPPPPAPSGSPEAARRLFRAGRSLIGTAAEAYLRARGITASLAWPSLRYHPSVYYRAHEDAPREVWPALLAAVTDLRGRITGVHRTWLDPIRRSKAPLADPRRALGHLLGNGVRFGVADDVVAAGEGIETMLSLKSILPTLPMIAALSANHLAALDLPPNLHRLYVARDNDAAGRCGCGTLRDRGAEAELEIRDLRPALADFNVDLCQLAPRRCSATSSRNSSRPTGCGLRRMSFEATCGKRDHDRRRRCRPGTEGSVECGPVLPEARAQRGLPERAICRRRRALPEPARNVAGRLFSAAGLRPALQRETK